MYEYMGDCEKLYVPYHMISSCTILYVNMLIIDCLAADVLSIQIIRVDFTLFFDKPIKWAYFTHSWVVDYDFIISSYLIYKKYNQWLSNERKNSHQFFIRLYYC